MPAAAQIKYASERGSLGFNATNYCDMRLAVIRKNLQYMVYILSMIKSLLCYILHVNWGTHCHWNQWFGFRLYFDSDSVMVLRPNGELLVKHRARGTSMLLAPPSSPISMIYRQGQYMVKIAESESTPEWLGNTFHTQSEVAELLSHLYLPSCLKQISLWMHFGWCVITK